MKKFAGLLTIVLSALSVVGCNLKNESEVQESPVVIYQGAVELADKKFGLYYGDRYGNNVGVYYVVLSDAMCYNNGYANPYMDSEGDMLVLEFHAPFDSENVKPPLPDGTYKVSETGTFTVNPEGSYVKKFIDNNQKKYKITSGEIVVVAGSISGAYDISAKNLVLTKGNETINASYTYEGKINFEDYRVVAPAQVGLKEDVIDMPFYTAEGGYYGDLYGCRTANYMITLSTMGFSEDDTNTVPGMMLVLNLFDHLPKGTDPVIAITPGTYKVQTHLDAAVGTMFFGTNMSDPTSGQSSPFGTFFYQITANGESSVEFIDSGYIKVDRSETPVYSNVYDYTIEYNFKSSSAGRSYKGTWVGEIKISDFSEDSERLVLSTLEKDVECDMSKVSEGRLQKIETLKSTLNTAQNPSYPLKDVWQVTLEPRDWTAEEKKIDPWEERLKAWTPDGDCMIFEFNLPLGSHGNIAPNGNTVYTYTIQPSCSIDSEDYTMLVSQMGRPYDDMFHPTTAAFYNYPTVYESWFPTKFDYCLSRRGFTWAGWFRGVWYYHMQKGKYFVMDENAPAIHGTISVFRVGDVYTFTWDLEDDALSPNKITGTWTGKLRRLVDLPDEDTSDEEQYI